MGLFLTPWSPEALILGPPAWALWLVVLSMSRCMSPGYRSVRGERPRGKTVVSGCGQGTVPYVLLADRTFVPLRIPWSTSQGRAGADTSEIVLSIPLPLVLPYGRYLKLTRVLGCLIPLLLMTTAVYVSVVIR